MASAEGSWTFSPAPRSVGDSAGALDAGGLARDSAGDGPGPAVQNRPRVANHVVHETCTMDTHDHEDHTFCGVMFDLSCRPEAEAGVPLESVVIEALSVRGNLGPLTVWVTPRGYAKKEHAQDEWELVYEKTHPPAWRFEERLQLVSPIRLKPGESCGVYVHSKLNDDTAIVYDDLRRSYHPGSKALAGHVLQVHPGQAHLSNEPFSREGMWWGVWRQNREFVGRLFYGLKYTLWNPNAEVHRRFPPSFRRAVQTLLLCARRPGCLLYSDEIVFFVLNMCRYDWFQEKGCGPATDTDLEVERNLRPVTMQRAGSSFASDSESESEFDFPDVILSSRSDSDADMAS